MPRVPASTAVHGLTRPPSDATIHQLFAEGLASVLQSHVDIVSPRYPTIRVAPWDHDAGVWVIRFSTPEAASTAQAGEVGEVGASLAPNRRLHLTLSHFDFAQCEVRQRSGTVPEDRALAWAGAAARQCQRAQAALGRGAALPDEAPSRWHWQVGELPRLRNEDVDAFELDLSGYLQRLVRAQTPPAVPFSARAHTTGSTYSAVSAASELDPVTSAPPDVASLAWCPEGIPAFHASSPTLMRTRDVARYLFARRRFAPARDLWRELKTWGVPKTALATFLNNDMGTRTCFDEGLREPWNGRLVCLDDLVAWEATAAHYEVRDTRTVAASTFAQSRHIDSRQFDDMTSMTSLHEVIVWHAQGRSLESLDRECTGLDISVIQRETCAPITYLLRMRRTRFAMSEPSRRSNSTQ
ncbi:hypothetical protein PIN31009_04232 [Pandoraea iniqua]|uniref:hypothetical protein n=1 Tax=Pandoraea iniqua TaxID=2508288 RepID=UPI00124207F1|nr:hypothetical protein [Pandoraea iniqua]VVE43341.1 hypothetical protein PIN31009_04232 [Pandoraea iniqua]